MSQTLEIVQCLQKNSFVHPFPWKTRRSSPPQCCCATVGSSQHAGMCERLRDFKGICKFVEMRIMLDFFYSIISRKSVVVSKVLIPSSSFSSKLSVVVVVSKISSIIIAVVLVSKTSSVDRISKSVVGGVS